MDATAESEKLPSRSLFVRCLLLLLSDSRPAGATPMNMLNHLKTIIDHLSEIVSLLRIIKNLAITLVSASKLYDPEQIISLLQEIAANTQPLSATPLLTERKIYKAEAIKILGISSRTYDRKKASGLLVPRGTGHDFYYPEDLEKAMEESKRRGRV